MNELQRQMYLSALGVDTYMPRWHLPFAAVSSECVLPNLTSVHVSEKDHFYISPENAAPDISLQVESAQILTAVTSINSLIVDFLEANKAEKPKLVRAPEVSPLNLTTASNVSLAVGAFSLSVWRPNENLMIIDSRNTKLALPTELLLRNMLLHLYPREMIELKGEVLRSPMVESGFGKSTINDVCTELQTWFSVQCEIRPIKYLWLMGSNATTYLLPHECEKDQYLWHSVLLDDSQVNALILPSLNELLRQPFLKKQLYSAIKHYIS